MVQKAHSKAPPENPVPKQPEKPTANQKPPMKIVTTGAAVSEIQTNMAALRERFSSSNRDIFNPFEKEFSDIWESEAIRLPTLGLDFSGFGF